jgi:hypothetical protein
MQPPHPTCGLCRLNLRGGDNPTRVRVVKEDCTPEVVAAIPALRGNVPEPGLYSLCGDCLKVLLPVVAARFPVEWDTSTNPPTVKKRGKKPEEMSTLDLM